MCKIMIMPGIKPEKSKAAMRFARAARPLLTRDDRDAFGYAALGDNGLFGERWTNVHEAFRDLETEKRGFARMLNILGDGVAPKRHGDYSRFGAKSERVFSVMLHSRWATCGGGIENAHPFVRDGVALIHNGVISNASALRQITSTCDSETILNAYVDANVDTNPDRIENVAAVLRGWYACGVFAKNGGEWIVDVFRDGMADLVSGYVAELDTVVFCTKKEILQKTAAKCGFRVMGITEVPKETLYRIDARTGMLVTRATFEARRYEFQTAEKPYRPYGKNRTADRDVESYEKWLREHTSIDGEFRVPESVVDDAHTDSVVAETVERAGLPSTEVADDGEGAWAKQIDEAWRRATETDTENLDEPDRFDELDGEKTANGRVADYSEFKKRWHR